MKYTKPEVMTLAEALSAVRGQKVLSQQDDGQFIPTRVTVSAYEADE